jgi:hypothetical protein
MALLRLSRRKSLLPKRAANATKAYSVPSETGGEQDHHRALLGAQFPVSWFNDCAGYVEFLASHIADAEQWSLSTFGAIAESYATPTSGQPSRTQKPTLRSDGARRHANRSRQMELRRFAFETTTKEAGAAASRIVPVSRALWNEPARGPH